MAAPNKSAPSTAKLSRDGPTVRKVHEALMSSYKAFIFHERWVIELEDTITQRRFANATVDMSPEQLAVVEESLEMAISDLERERVEVR
jgi:hypothetical protein